MAFVYYPDNGGKILEAFGLDPNKVTRAHFDFEVGEVVKITVEMYMDQPDLEGLRTATSIFKLVPINQLENEELTNHGTE